jgi:NAD(P)-dependent dehydrogenase (short-subunit alcohol dehydrogenase family)
MAELSGKRALVTGAGSGLGLAIASKFVELGAQVMLSDINEESVGKAAAELGASSVRCDVTVSADVQAAIKATTEAFGGIDTLVNNAGIEQIGPIVEHSEEDFEKIFAVNVRGVFLGIKYGAPAIIGSGGGSIVNMSSVAGLGGPAFFGIYGATKAAVVSLTQTSAVELRDFGVRVNALCPAFIATPMVVDRAIGTLGPIVEAALNRPLETVLHDIQGRLGEPDEVAEVAAFLASDRASFVSGAAVPIDNTLIARLI